jgi:hypothetical protein
MTSSVITLPRGIAGHVLATPLGNAHTHATPFRIKFYELEGEEAHKVATAEPKTLPF